MIKIKPYVRLKLPNITFFVALKIYLLIKLLEMMTYLKSVMKIWKIKKMFSSIPWNKQNGRQPEYITKTNYYKTFRKKIQSQITHEKLEACFFSRFCYKSLIKSLCWKAKPTLSSSISSNQKLYEEKRCISKSGRLTSDIMEICDKKIYFSLLGDYGSWKSFWFFRR